MTEYWDWADVASIGICARMWRCPVWIILKDPGTDDRAEREFAASGIRYGWAEAEREQNRVEQFILGALPHLTGVQRDRI